MGLQNLLNPKGENNVLEEFNFEELVRELAGFGTRNDTVHGGGQRLEAVEEAYSVQNQ